jgi:hypothetical protein
MRMRLVALCLALSCGGPQRAATTASGYAVKVYAPMRIKTDAKSPTQAVILGTDVNNGSTIIPLPPAGGTAVVDSLTLTAAPNRDGTRQTRIAVQGSTQSRASVWTAAFVAASILDKDFTDFTFAATGDTTGSAPGSGLIAAGFLAAMTGAPIDPKATVIGMVNPDGTIGPVAGVPEQVTAAIAAGKTRIGHPPGMRVAKSTKSGELIDIVELAKGAELVEVADVHRAFHVLTGKQLPQPVGVPEPDMALDKTTRQAIDAKYKQWQQRLATEWGAILQLETTGRLPPLLVTLRDYSKRHAAAAEKHHKTNQLAAAYSRMVTAYVYAASANQIYDVVANVQAAKLDAAVATIARLDKLGEQAKDTLLRIGSLRPPTLGGHLQMMSAFRRALRAFVFKDFAARSLAATKTYLESLKDLPATTLVSDKTAEEIVTRAAPAILYAWKTVAETTVATEQLDFANATDIAYRCSPPDMLRLAMSFQTAGTAALGYVDALLVEPYAESEKLDLGDARTRIALAEPDYLVTATASKLSSLDISKHLLATWGDRSLAWSLLSLASGQLAYFHAAALIAKYDSLDAQLDDTRLVHHVEHAKAFESVLASAERSARASARAARIATGSIPVQAKLAYQLASVGKQGTLDDRIDALAQYWSSSLFSQTAVMLARN